MGLFNIGMIINTKALLNIRKKGVLTNSVVFFWLKMWIIPVQFYHPRI